MIKNLLIIGLTFFRFYIPAQNFSVTYGFPEVTTSTGTLDPSNSPTITGLTFSPFHAFGTSANPNASARFSFTGWPVGALSTDDNYGNYTALLSPTIYYEVALFVDPGYTLNLTTLNFDVRRSGTGVRTFCVRSGLDNFTNNLSASTGTNSNLEVIPNDVFFWKYDTISTSNDQKGCRINFDEAYSSITGSLVMHFYGWNSEANGGSFSIDNVNFNGILSYPLSLKDHEKKNILPEKIRLYPNPWSTGKLVVEMHEDLLKIELYSVTNHNIELAFIKTGEEQVEIDLKEFAQGVYYLRLFTENKTISKKLVITN